jgi:hypothetical protein
MRGLLIAVGVWALAAQPIFGQKPDYFISCTLTSSFDIAKGGAGEPVAGNDSFGVTHAPNGSVNYSLPFPCADGTVETRISETEMWFSCQQDIDGRLWDRFALIDRISGQYQKGFAPQGKNGLLFVGSCERTERRF